MRILDPAVSRYPVPWLTNYARRMQEMFGGELYPYGIEANRTTLDAFLGYAFEQGVCRRPLTAEALFAPEVRDSFKI